MTRRAALRIDRKSERSASNASHRGPEHQAEAARYMVQPTNLILYGPPGTGKTYATAAEAVRLFGEPVPGDRKELMAAYHRLSDTGRIEFVTFHQSTSYEDFVEGLRPTQGREDGTAGFELKPEQGVFRRIARRAESSTGPGDADFSINGRQAFKMSIGEAANPDDSYLFEEAITGGYTLLGFEDIDWSDYRFADRDAIIEAVRARGGSEGGEPSAMSGRVRMPFIFRNWVKPGDIVVVSKGNSLFRAIGEVIGNYQFVPREGGDYGHRRRVRWLWVDTVLAPPRTGGTGPPCRLIRSSKNPLALRRRRIAAIRRQAREANGRLTPDGDSPTWDMTVQKRPKPLLARSVS
jgi:5-methylcytosine-specific restriction protein B